MTSDTSASSFSLKTLATVVLTVGVLYWAKSVFIPLALALLLSFLLAPLVTRLRRWGFGRRLAVASVTLLVFVVIFTLGWIVFGQFVNLAHELPSHRRNIQAKIQALHRPLSERFEKASKALLEIQDQFSNPTNDRGRQKRTASAKVEVLQPGPTLVQAVRGAIGPIFRPLGTAGLVTLLVICMLLNKDDLRSRLIRLFGRHRLPATTQALDEAARGVSQFLLMQSILNGSYGLVFGLGLFLIGLPNSLLWGFAAAVLRFVPYMGSWIAASMPIVFSVAISSGWKETLLVVGLFLLLELVSNYLAEPWLYGTTTGLSPLGVILAAVFWTWLWGAAGLLLSTPLTVCLIVISRNVPQLEFFSILLGDQPVLGPRSRFYHMLLASDEKEVGRLVAQQLTEKSLLEVCETVFFPILRIASNDRHRGMLEAKRAALLFATLRKQIANLNARSKTVQSQKARPSQGFVMCVPAQDETDELAALLFSKLLAERQVDARVMRVDALTSALNTKREVMCLTVLCVSALSASGLEAVVQTTGTLRALFPALHILVALWDVTLDKQAEEKLESAGSDDVVTTLRDGIDAVFSKVENSNLLSETHAS